MIKKIIFVLLTTLFLTGCDRQTALLINNDGYHKLIHTDCGDIKMHAHIFGRHITVTYDFISGNYLFSSDSLKIKLNALSNEIEKLEFYNYGSQDKTEFKSEVIKSPRKIHVVINLKRLPLIPKETVGLFIIPTHYLRCNSGVSIKDSIYLHYP